MTSDRWLQIAVTILIAVVAAIIGGMVRAFSGGRYIAQFEGRIINIESDLERVREEMTRRFERGSKLTSELASEVQALPDRIRREIEQRYMRTDVMIEKLEKKQAEIERILIELEVLRKRIDDRRRVR